MADKFYDGMPNVNEELNKMNAAFEKGPYNALPLTGGALVGGLTSNSGIVTSSIIQAQARAPGASANVGLQSGWWRVARVLAGALSGEAILRISGATVYSANDNSANGVMTTVLLRCDNDGKVRGSFYSEGAASGTISEVRIHDDGTVYVLAPQFASLSVYLDTNIWMSQTVGFAGTEVPPGTRPAIPIWVLKIGGGNAISAAGNRIDFGLPVASGALFPIIDNSFDVGTPSTAYRTVYARTGTINTSDARLKCDFRGLSTAEIAAARDIAHAIGTYRWRDAVDCKGVDAREHIGPTVQRAIEIMQSHGLDPFNYGFICYDEWQREVIEHPAIEARAAHTEVILEAGDRYAFRYDELAMFIAAGQEARLAALEAVA